jgi:hypothetical protein
VASKQVIKVEGTLFGKPLSTTVDNGLAKLMLTNPLDNEVLELFKIYEQKPLITKTLAEISKKYSMDVASFFFLQKAYQNKENKGIQDLYSAYLTHQHANVVSPEMAHLQDYYLVFVPGLAYKQDTTTGADFARQRQLLSKNNIQNELIETGEWDLSDENAQIIAARLKTLSKQHENLIVVSASKGSLEVAITLGEIMESEESKSIKSWISVGGILRGSPIADSFLKAPKCWLAQLMLWTKGKNIDTVKDLSYQRRNEDFKQLIFPKHLKIIQLVGVPLATQISKEIKSRYFSMIYLGPNDGLTPLADELIENGIIVSELGLDHYFRDPHIDKKTLALALAAISDNN